MKGLLRRTDEPPSPFTCWRSLASAVEALESQRAAHNQLPARAERPYAIDAGDADRYLADISGQSDVSVARLQAIEQQIERAHRDWRTWATLRARLESCLAALRDAAAQQRKGSTATVQRLREQISGTQSACRRSTFQAAAGAIGDIDLEPEDVRAGGGSRRGCFLRGSIQTATGRSHCHPFRRRHEAADAVVDQPESEDGDGSRRTACCAGRGLLL